MLRADEKVRTARAGEGDAAGQSERLNIVPPKRSAHALKNSKNKRSRSVTQVIRF
jgi:hypothetical protein